MQEIAHLAAQEKPLVSTGHKWLLEGLPVLLHNHFKQLRTSFKLGISSNLTIKRLALQHKPIKTLILTCNYTQTIPTLPSTCWNSWRWLVLLMYVTIWGQRAIISCTTRHAVDNSNFPSSRACKRTIITQQLYYSDNYGAPLPIRTILKYCVDCTQRSSRSPFNCNRRARSIEHMSILPITLKLGLCNERSNCTGVNEKGY